MLLAFFSLFVFGLALNLTPCVYPLIPVTISYFSRQSEHKTCRGFSSWRSCTWSASPE